MQLNEIFGWGEKAREKKANAAREKIRARERAAWEQKQKDKATATRQQELEKEIAAGEEVRKRAAAKNTTKRNLSA